MGSFYYGLDGDYLEAYREASRRERCYTNPIVLDGETKCDRDVFLGVSSCILEDIVAVVPEGFDGDLESSGLKVVRGGEKFVDSNAFFVFAAVVTLLRGGFDSFETYLKILCLGRE